MFKQDLIIDARLFFQLKTEIRKKLNIFFKKEMLELPFQKK